MTSVFACNPITGNAARRTVTGNDSALAAIDGASFLAKPSVKCLGNALLKLDAAHNSASGSITVRLVFYDLDDEVVGVSDEQVLDATALNAAVLNESGVSNTRYLSASEFVAPLGGSVARIYVVSLSTSTSVDLFLETYDEVTR